MDRGDPWFRGRPLGRQLNGEPGVEGHYSYLHTQGGAGEGGSYESRASSHHTEIDEKPTHG